MKSLLIGCVTAMTIGIAAAAAQSSGDPSKGAAASSDPASTPTFIQMEQTGLFRAPKLIGVAVYDAENKSVGKIADILLDHSGDAKVVVIGVGGFLGIDTKDVAVPYASIHWQTEKRSVATNEPLAGTSPASNSLGQSADPADKPASKTIEPAKTEAYQGYPDRAVIDLSQAQLKSAPEFKYAPNPEAGASMSTSTNSVAKTSQKP